MTPNDYNQRYVDAERGRADDRERFRCYDYSPLPEPVKIKHIPMTLEEFFAHLDAVKQENIEEDRAYPYSP